jgi:integrase
VTRARNRLSDRRVKTAKPGMHCDGGGLYLQAALGAGREVRRSWLFRFATGEARLSENGKRYNVERQMGLGTFPDTSLAEAREKAAQARKLREQGIDPIAARNSQRAALVLASAKTVTFDQCRDGYFDSHRAGWASVKHATQWGTSLRDHVSPVFGAFPVAAVDTGLVLKALEPLWTTKHVTAQRLRTRIENVLDWAKARGYREGENPARWKGHLSELLPKSSNVHSVKHHPALPYAEIAGLVAELRARDDRDARCLELLILTASRVGAVVGARAEEFDLTGRTWTIPAARMKRRGSSRAKPHRVPLSDAAVAVAKRVGKNEGLLFPGASDVSLEKAHRRADITTHGFRSTFRDWAAECTAFPREVIEMAMAHAVGDETEAAYFRSDLFEKRRRLMEAWADFCGKARVAGAVVPLRAKAQHREERG